MGDQPTDHVSRLVPCLIFWFIWAERNNSRHRNEKFRPLNISWQINMYLRRLSTLGTLGPKHWSGCVTGQEFGGRPRCITRTPSPALCKWQPPPEPCLKLNLSSSFSSASSRGKLGGIFRNHEGSLVLAFATILPAISDLEAQLLATLQGLIRGRTFNRKIEIEMESSRVTSIIERGDSGPALSRNVTANIRLLLRDLDYNFITVPRAANKAAQALASMATEEGSPMLFDEHTAPNLLRALVLLEMRQIPNLELDVDDPPLEHMSESPRG